MVFNIYPKSMQTDKWQKNSGAADMTGSYTEQEKLYLDVKTKNYCVGLGTQQACNGYGYTHLQIHDV